MDFFMWLILIWLVVCMIWQGVKHFWYVGKDDEDDC